MVFFLPLQKHNSKSSFEHLAVQTEKRTENVLMNESRCKILLNHCMFQISPAQIYCSAARRTYFFFFCKFYRNIQFLCLYNRCRAILLMEMLLINPLLLLLLLLLLLSFLLLLLLYLSFHFFNLSRSLGFYCFCFIFTFL